MSAAFDQDAGAPDCPDGMTHVGEAARRVLGRCRPRPYQPFPRSDMGRRELAAFIRLHGGVTEEATRINWDLDPIRWAMRHEIEAAGRWIRAPSHRTHTPSTQGRGRPIKPVQLIDRSIDGLAGQPHTCSS